MNWKAECEQNLNISELNCKFVEYFCCINVDNEANSEEMENYENILMEDDLLLDRVEVNKINWKKKRSKFQAATESDLQTLSQEEFWQRVKIQDKINHLMI